MAVLPAGAWGAAFSRVAAEAGHDVRLYFRNKGGRFPPEFEQALAGADVVVLAPPSRYLRGLYREIKLFIPAGASILCLTKGLEQETNLRMSQVLEQEEVGINQRLAVLSGPNLAQEVAQGLPAAAVVASSNYSLAEKMQEIFSTRVFRIYAQDDLPGVEYGGALKNIIAIAAGVSDGLEYGENARAALINRGLSEMIRLAVKLGGREQTIRGLSGEGDLWLTCTSSRSRNHQARVELARGITPKELLASGQTYEGIFAVKAAVELAKQHGVDMPIAQAVYEVLCLGSTVQEAVRRLTERSLVHENGN